MIQCEDRPYFRRWSWKLRRGEGRWKGFSCVVIFVMKWSSTKNHRSLLNFSGVGAGEEQETHSRNTEANREVLQTEFRKLRRKRAAAGYESRKIMAHLSENPSERSVRPASNRTKFSVRFCGLSHTFRSAAQRWTMCLSKTVVDDVPVS